MKPIIKKNANFPVWDIAIRLFHWSLVLAVLASWLSNELANFDVHQWSGYSVIVLLVFRLVWGIVGSQHAQFRDFVVGPRAVIRYFKTGEYDSAGHNPLGALSVLALLVVLLTMVISGLFNTDDLLFSGPLSHLISSDERDFAGLVHEITFNLLLVLVLLHVAAVLYHQIFKKEALIQTMIWGKYKSRSGKSKPRHWLIALSVLLITIMLYYGLLEMVPKPKPSFW